MMHVFLKIRFLCVALLGLIIGCGACYLYQALLIPYMIENRTDLPVYTYSTSKVISAKECFLKNPNDSTFKELDAELNLFKPVYPQENIPYYLIYSNHFKSREVQEWFSEFSNKTSKRIGFDKSTDSLFTYIIKISND